MLGRKKRDAMANGKPLTKKVPFWISWDDKSNNFVLNDLAISFKHAFKMSIEHGHGSYYISKFLNLNNYPAPVGNFHKSYILKTLHNVAVYGCYMTPNIEPIEGYFPPLITKEEFELNLALMKSRDKRGGRIGKGFPNIFTGKLIFCANCEGRMVYRSKGVGFRNSRFLHCSNSERSNISVCSCPIFNYIEFDLNPAS